MIVYLDLVIVLNFFVNFLLLLVIEKCFKDKISILKLSLASFVGALIVLVSLYNLFCYKIFRFLGGIIILLIGIKNCSKQKKVIKISMFYTENLALVGFLNTFKVNTCLFLIFATGAILCLLLIEHFKNYYIFKANNEYKTIIRKNKSVLELKGFLDTGNAAISPTGLPIVFINQKYYSNDFNEYEDTVIETVCGEIIVKAYKIDECIVYYNKERIEKDIRVVFTSAKEDCILNCMIII